MLQLILILSTLVGLQAEETFYFDSFNETPLTKEEIVQHDKANTTFWCTVELAPCDPEEGRRVDGTCNNLDHPSRGTAHTPFRKLLPLEYGEGFEPRLKTPLCRHARTTLLQTGIRPDLTFTHLLTHFSVFMAVDLTTIQDSINYVIWKPQCCHPEGKSDYMCTPHEVPANDPVHRFSGISCMNMTRPFTYQSVGCIPYKKEPERITSATPTFDLSHVYGSDLKKSLEKTRLFSRGMLKYEVDSDGRIYLPSAPLRGNICFQNQPGETRCHDTGEDGNNSVLGINLFTIWFWRNHNRIASALADMNPCWDDEKIYSTAKDINIATASQIYYYEFFSVLLGRENLLRESVLSPDLGFRDLYKEELHPNALSEFVYANRWFHTMQEGRIKMYDGEGNYLKQMPVVNLTLRTGYLAIDNNIDYITQGSFRQASGKIDHTVDPERLELLKDLYGDVINIELIAGLWMENSVPGGYVPETFYCIAINHLLWNIQSDRHWYERPNRPNAFSLEQLLEIRKATVSQLLCDVGDKVTNIQRHGFIRAGLHNKMVSCSKIPRINLTLWMDKSCNFQTA